MLCDGSGELHHGWSCNGCMNCGLDQRPAEAFRMISPRSTADDRANLEAAAAAGDTLAAAWLDLLAEKETQLCP